MSARVWAEIDLAAIRENVDAIRAHVGMRVDVMAVVKADAYGHGAIEVARVATTAGASCLGVACAAEGMALRKALPAATICLLSPFCRDEIDDILAARLTPGISDLDGARALSQAAMRSRSGLRAHLEVDTGMGRHGVACEQAERVADHVARLGGITITGMYTHFASAEDDPEFTHEQLARFLEARKAVELTDTRLKPVHCANSAAILRYPDTWLDMVRPGLLIYGILPSLPADVDAPPLRAVLTLKTRIVLVREMPVGQAIGYGRSHVLRRRSRIAVLPVGYGDGYPRGLGNVGRVVVEGEYAPIVGRVCMDATTIDVTDIPGASTDSEVALIGRQGQNRITVEEIARLVSTTEHAVTTGLTSRVARVYRG